MEEEDITPTQDDTDYCLSLPYRERLEHKNWKVRSKALEDFANQLKESLNEESALRELGTQISKTTGDSNQNVLDSGFEACLTFFSSVPFHLSNDIADRVMSNAIDKAFGARPSTQSKAKSLLLKIVELSDPSAATAQLLSKLSDKRPKIPPMCLDTLTEGIIAFGATKFPVKDILKSLPALFNSTNAPVRDSSMKLLVELHRWIGLPPLQTLLDSIRPAQKTEFEKFITDRTDIPPVPTIYLSSEKHLIGQEINQVVASKVDARDFVDEVDLGKKLKATDFNTLIDSEKWIEQAQALDIVIDAIGPTPKLKQTPIMSDLMKSCHELLKNGHLQVQLKSMKVICLIAEGLRQKFAVDVRQLVPTIILKSKEKKLTSEVENCCVVVFSHVVNPDYLTDEIVEILVSKKSPPHSKQCLNQICERVFTGSTGAISADNVKRIFDAMIANCEDPDPKVRETSVKGLNAMQKSEKYGIASNDLFKSLKTGNPKLSKKISETGDTKSELLSKTAVLNVSAPRSKDTSALSQTLPVKSTAVKPATVIKTPEETAGVKKSQSTRPVKDAPEAELDDCNDDGKLSVEDAKAFLMGIEAMNINDIEEKFASAKWQDKVDACTTLSNLLDLDYRTLNALFSLVYGSTNNFKISNINVLKAVLEMFALLFSKCGEGKSCKFAAIILINCISDKWGDKKIQVAMEALCKSLCMSIGSSPVIKKMNKNVEASKSPTVHQAYLQWLKVIIENGEHKDIPILSIVQLCVKEMDNKTSGVRTAAIEIMGCLYSKLGPPLLSFMNMKDVNPQIKSLLDAEFAKVGFNPASAKESNLASGLLPRRDLGEVLDKSTLSDLSTIEGKDSWQIRKAAMEKILTACEASGHYLDASKTVVEVLKSLKQRLADTQSNLKPIAALCIAHIIASLELDKSVKLTKIYAHPLLEGLIDSKKNMRDSTIAALNVAVRMNTADVETSIFMCFVSNSSEILLNVIPRQELLSWFLENEKLFVGDCGELVPSLISCLQDKIATVRTNSELLMIKLIANSIISKASIEKSTRDLAPASKRAIQPIIDRILNVDLASDKPQQQNIGDSTTTDAVEMVTKHTKQSISELKSDKASEAMKEVPSDKSNDSAIQQSPSKAFSDDLVLQAFNSIEWSLCPSPDQYNKLRLVWSEVIESDFAETVFAETGSAGTALSVLAQRMDDIKFTKKYFGFVLYWSSNYVMKFSSQRETSLILDLLTKLIKISTKEKVLCGDILGIVSCFLVKFDQYDESTKVLLRRFLLEQGTKVSTNKCFNRIASDLGYFSPSAQSFAIQILNDILKNFGFGSISKSTLVVLWKFIAKEAKISSQDHSKSESIKQFLTSMLKFVDHDFRLVQSITGTENTKEIEEIFASFSLSKLNSSDGRIDTSPSLLSRVLSRMYICMDTLTRKANDELMETELKEHVNRLLHTKFPDNSIDKTFVRKCTNFICYGLTNSVERLFILALLSKVINQTNVLTLMNSTDLADTIFDFIQLLNSGCSSLFAAASFVLNEIIAGANMDAMVHGLFQLQEKNSADLLTQKLFPIVCCRLVARSNSASFLSSFCKRFDDFCCDKNVQSVFILTQLAKTVFQNIIQLLGADEFVNILRASELNARSLSWTLGLKLAHIQQVSSSLDGEIVSLINEITVSNDKIATIKTLYMLQKSNPQINVNVHLQQLSSAFRKFVLETMAKLEEADLIRKSLDDNSDAKENKGDIGQQSESTTEAFRILESLKAKPSPLKSYSAHSDQDPVIPPSPAKGPLASPFARRNEKIRDSLSTLSKSLDLPTISGPLTENESLEDRLQRLKSMK